MREMSTSKHFTEFKSSPLSNNVSSWDSRYQGWVTQSVWLLWARMRAAIWYLVQLGLAIQLSVRDIGLLDPHQRAESFSTRWLRNNSSLFLQPQVILQLTTSPHQAVWQIQ